MKRSVWISTVILSFAACWMAAADDAVPMCDEGQLYWAVDGSGNTTVIAVFSEMPPMGEQLGEFDLVLMGDEPVDCHGKPGQHRRNSSVLRWQGILRGRQTFEEGMHHALVNSSGYGYAFTEDEVDLSAPCKCETDGIPGMLLRETLNFSEGVWNDLRIHGGSIVVDVCLPQVANIGSPIWFEVIDGSYLCLSPDGENL